MSDEDRVYHPKEGLKISYYQNLRTPRISTEVPIVFRKSVRNTYFSDRDPTSSPSEWNRDSSLFADPGHDLSERKLQAYVEEADAYEDIRRQRPIISNAATPVNPSTNFSRKGARATQDAVAPLAVRKPYTAKPGPRAAEVAASFNFPLQKSTQSNYLDPKTSREPISPRQGYAPYPMNQNQMPVYHAYRPDRSLIVPSDSRRTGNQKGLSPMYAAGGGAARGAALSGGVPPDLDETRSVTSSLQAGESPMRSSFGANRSSVGYSDDGFEDDRLDPSRGASPLRRTKSSNRILGNSPHSSIGSPQSAGGSPQFSERSDRTSLAESDIDDARLERSMEQDGEDDASGDEAGENVRDDMEGSQRSSMESARSDQSDDGEVRKSMQSSARNSEDKQDDLGRGSFASKRGSVASSISDIGPADEKGISSDQAEQKRPLWKRPWLWIVIGIVLVLLIAGGVAAAFFIIRSKKESSENTNAPGGFLTEPPALAQKAFAMTGTSMAGLTTSATVGTSGSNFVNFYQHSSGDLRMTTFSNSQWQPSKLVTTDAHQGTPITAYLNSDGITMSVFYFDKNKVLQELRGTQASTAWTNGTIGALEQTSDTPSALASQYAGVCQGTGLAWLVFHTGDQDQARLLYWNQDTDTWAASGAFPGVKQGPGFTGQQAAGVWRFYYVSNQTSQLEEQVCPDCCTNPKSTGWRAGLNGPQVASSISGMAVATVGVPRLVYYQDPDGTIRELNNTNQFPKEAWVTNTASNRGGNTGTIVPDAQIGPVGMPVAKAMPNTKMTVTTGFLGSTPQILLFYQANGTDVTMQLRNANQAGQWSVPSPIPVGQ